eukprot:567503-Ditylum_brightwellii.AAC.1
MTSDYPLTHRLMTEPFVTYSSAVSLRAEQVPTSQKLPLRRRCMDASVPVTVLAILISIPAILK